MSLIMGMVLSGCVTKLVNVSNEAWNKTDQAAYERARSVCATDSRYIGNRCLKYFEKVSVRKYRAICGPVD